MEGKEEKKGAKALSAFIGKASDIGKKATDLGKKAAGGIQKGTKVIVEKTKNDMLQRRIKKYNPVFPDDYRSEQFHTPNMIVIVDDAVRREIDVCEGAIGWLGNEGGTEVLFLYDEWASESGVTFVPSIDCDAAYYIDSFDRNRYIRVDTIFSRAQDERLAELENIAFMLGAKSYNIEIVETTSEASSKDMKVKNSLSGKGNSASETNESHVSNSSREMRSSRTSSVFKTQAAPRVPKLKWFAHNHSMLQLIKMRCSEDNYIESKVLEIQGSTISALSKSAACSIDAALGKLGNAKSSVSMESQANKEHNSILIFNVQF